MATDARRGTAVRPWWQELVAGPGMLRMSLALLVFVSHVSRFEVGRPAVMIFFMLSGYWVLRLLDGNRGGVVRFEADRLLRIWPLFAVVTMLALLAENIAGVLPQGSLASTLPLLGLASRTGDMLGVSWSLDVEMQFYLVLPLALWAISRLEVIIDSIGQMLVLAMVTMAGAVLLSRGIVTVAAYAPAFAVGALIWRRRWSPPLAVALLSVAAFAACGILFAVAPDLQTLLLKTESQWWRDLMHLGWCLLLAPFVAWNVHQPSDGLDRHLGNLSFPFYLVHPLVITVCATAFGGVSSVEKTTALVGSVVLALLLYALVDRPIERVRKIMRRT